LRKKKNKNRTVIAHENDPHKVYAAWPLRTSWDEKVMSTLVLGEGRSKELVEFLWVILILKGR